MGIPVFHDDQHGTAVVVLAALLNSLKIVKKRIEDMKIVVAGVGAAGRGVQQDHHERRRAQHHRRGPRSGRSTRGASST